jgi:hypothetical protein
MDQKREKLEIRKGIDIPRTKQEPKRPASTKKPKSDRN